MSAADLNVQRAAEVRRRRSILAMRAGLWVLAAVSLAAAAYQIGQG